MTDGFLRLTWSLWGVIAATSWLVVFAASWFSVLHGLAVPEDPLNLWMWVPGIALCFMSVANGLPGAAAALNPAMRSRLLIVPAAAALSLVTVSGVAGIVAGAMLALAMGMEVGLIGVGAVLGVLIFPLSFGLVFPLAIPLLCGLAAWSLAGKDGGMSRRAYMWLTTVSAVGWLLVVVVGTILGLA